MELLSHFFSEQYLKEINLHDSGATFSLKNPQLPISIRNFIAIQIDLKKKLKKKIPSFVNAGCLVTQKSFEQATGEYIASFKSDYFNCDFKLVTDLTGGLGVETLFWVLKGKNVHYIEQDKELLNLARFNFNRLNIAEKVKMTSGNSLDYLLHVKENSLVIADPDRRGNENKRILKTEELLPNPIKIWEQLKTKKVFILLKLPPIIDITFVKNTFTGFNEIMVVSWKNEVKEIGVWRDPDKQIQQVTAVNIDYNGNRNQFSYQYDHRSEKLNHKWTAYQTEPYLIFPFRSLIKAELTLEYAGSLNLKPMSNNIPLLPCSLKPENVLGNLYEILLHDKYNPKTFAQMLKINQIKTANIISFSHEIITVEIEKRFKIPPGESNHFFFYKNPETEKHLFFWCKKI